MQGVFVCAGKAPELLCMHTWLSSTVSGVCQGILSVSCPSHLSSQGGHSCASS